MISTTLRQLPRQTVGKSPNACVCFTSHQPPHDVQWLAWRKETSASEYWALVSAAGFRPPPCTARTWVSKY